MFRGVTDKAHASSFQSILAYTLLYGVAGIGILLVNLWNVHALRQAQNGLPTTGRVVKTEIQRNRRLHVVYTYRAWGKTYTGDRFSPTSRDAPPSMQSRYRPGQVVRVFVDPQHPERAVLVRHDPAGWASPMWRVVGLMFILLSPVFGVSTWISSRLFPHRIGRWRF